MKIKKPALIIGSTRVLTVFLSHLHKTWLSSQYQPHTAIIRNSTSHCYRKQINLMLLS